MNRDLRVQVEGALLERLVQKALDAGAVFAHVRRTGPRSMEFQTDFASARILTALCRKYALNARILHRGGRAAWMDLFRRRKTLLAGILLCILLCTGFLSRIWRIDIAFTGSCAHLGSAESIRTVLQQSGVHAGMSAGEINTDLLQKQLYAAAGDYSFIGVRRQGIRLLVEAAPEVPAPGIYAIGTPRDLVASRDGIVESIQVYSGEACVQPGDTVLKGQLLIRGEEAVSEDKTVAVGALGSVSARCWFEGSAEADCLRIIERPTGRTRTSCALKLMQFSIPVIECDPYPLEQSETERLPVVGLFLPLEIEKTTHRETTTVGRQADEDALQAQLEQLALADVHRRLPDAPYEIASRWTDAQRNEHSLRIRAVYEICTDIAAERDALTEEVY